MRVFPIAVALVSITALPAAAQVGNPAGMTAATPEREPGTPAPHQPNAQDRLFIYLLGTGGMAEVEGARAANKQASSAAIKDFARRMVQDHTKANEQLAGLAKAARVPLPNALDPDHQAQRAELDKLNGRDFDLAYMQQQLVEHQKTATILQWEIASGQDAELQRFAMDTLPAVLEHLGMVQAIISQITGAAPQGLAAAAWSAQTATSPSRTARDRSQ
jgi:putative membrane protein